MSDGTNRQVLPSGEIRHYTRTAGEWRLDWRLTAVARQQGAGAGKTLADVEADYGNGAAQQPPLAE